MVRILCIESSTEVCSVALVENGKVIAFREELEGQNHSKLLTVFIEELFQELKITASQLNAVAVSEGPGSYTGLRIGVSVAKGICYAANVPLIAISSLQAMAHQVLVLFPDKTNSATLIPLMDARRMEVFTSVYNATLDELQKVEAKIIDENSFAEYLDAGKVFFFGNGAEKCRKVIDHCNAIFIDDIITSAKSMAQLAQAKFVAGDFVDVAYFEPFYLKDFIALKAKNSVLSGLLKSKAE